MLADNQRQSRQPGTPDQESTDHPPQLRLKPKSVPVHTQHWSLKRLLLNGPPAQAADTAGAAVTGIVGFVERSVLMVEDADIFICANKIFPSGAASIVCARLARSPSGVVKFNQVSSALLVRVPL